MRRSAAALLLLLPWFAACGSDDNEEAGSFCDRADLVEERFADIEEGFEASEVPDPEIFERAADTLEDLADGAPAEIEDDLQTIADGARRIGEVFSEFDFSDEAALADPANAEALAEIGKEMSQVGADVEAATSAVEAYLESECGVSVAED
jgi:hypothetical protein